MKDSKGRDRKDEPDECLVSLSEIRVDTPQVKQLYKLENDEIKRMLREKGTSQEIGRREESERFEGNWKEGFNVQQLACHFLASPATSYYEVRCADEYLLIVTYLSMPFFRSQLHDPLKRLDQLMPRC
jgi:hypothetical protein